MKPKSENLLNAGQAMLNAADWRANATEAAGGSVAALTSNSMSQTATAS
jgi:hypothetical protein